MIEEFIKNLIVTYVPDTLIRAMIQVIFLSGCLSIVLILLSVGRLCMSISDLVDRILPIKKSEVVKGDSLWVRIKSSKLGSRLLGKAS